MDKQTLIFTIMILLLLITSIGMFAFYKSYEEKSEHCIVYGSMEHQMRYASDYQLASWIKQNGGELGPYFDYKFCE